MGCHFLLQKLNIHKKRTSNNYNPRAVVLESELSRPTVLGPWRGRLKIKLPALPQTPGIYSSGGGVCSVVQGLTLCNPWIITCQAPLSMELSRQEYWSGLPFPPPDDLPNPGMKPASPESPILAGVLFTAEPPGKPLWVGPSNSRSVSPDDSNAC